MANKTGVYGVGVDVDLIDDSAKHELGTPHETVDGKKYRYVKFTAAVSAKDACKIDNADASEPWAVQKTAAATDVVVGIAHQAFGSGKFGWLQTHGSVVANLATSVAAGDRLIPTSTAGRLGPYANTDTTTICAVAVDAESSNSGEVYVNGFYG